jgi:uncharacterized lipoprotein YbaY
MQNQYRALNIACVIMTAVWCWAAATTCAQDVRDRDASFDNPMSTGPGQVRYLPPAQLPPNNFKLGIYSRNTPTGVQIQNIVPGSVAQQAGIEPQDTIVNVGGYQVGIVDGRIYDIADELARRVNSQGRVTLLVRNHRDGQLINIPVQFYAANRVVTGTVNTGNRNLAQPPMFLIVRLLDVTRPEWRDLAITESQIPITGRWPIDYRMEVDPARIRPDHRYAVDARVINRGLIVLETSVPVSTGIATSDSRANLTLIPKTRPPSTQPPMDLISGWYQQFLNRPPTPRENATWQAELAQGKSLDDVQATILSGSEYYELQRNNPDKYVDSLFQQLNGRAPTPQERQQWSELLSKQGDLRYRFTQDLLRQRTAGQP